MYHEIALFKNIYCQYFSDSKFIHQFYHIERKKGYKTCNKTRIPDKRSAFEMREYYPIETDTDGLFSVLPKNVMVYNDVSIKTAIKHNFIGRENEIVISDEALYFFSQLYKINIFYDKSLHGHVLFLFSISNLFKPLKNCIIDLALGVNDNLYYEIYIQHLKWCCETSNGYIKGKTIAEFAVKCKSDMKHIKTAIKELVAIENMCKFENSCCGKLRWELFEAKVYLITTFPAKVQFKMVEETLFYLLQSIDSRKHYCDLRDVLREFVRGECKTRFFLNFNLYDFILFYTYYLERVSGCKISKLASALKAKYKIVFTHEKLIISPEYIFEWYFLPYCKIFVQNCEYNQKMQFIVNKGKKLVRKPKTKLSVKIINNTCGNIVSNQKVFPFSPLLERIKSNNIAEKMWSSKKRLNFE